MLTAWASGSWLALRLIWIGLGWVKQNQKIARAFEVAIEDLIEVVED